ncbi:hypothetical protein NGH88_00005 [Enterococcus faecalis]|uniref:hypothetical protein n=1 Tax=Enterococcus faecalis TaxID=1351 RepID=UPI002DBC8DEE|nr:hypothetical protein [Enterococcus faecalis]MEB7919450.1 hypothetical protein [Enterococcus faecalis]
MKQREKKSNNNKTKHLHFQWPKTNIFMWPLTQINSSLESYKEFAKGSTNKMISAGKNKANDDKAGAATMKISQ